VPSLKCIAWNGRIVIVGFAGGTIEKVRFSRCLVRHFLRTILTCVLIRTDSRKLALVEELHCDGCTLVSFHIPLSKSDSLCFLSSLLTSIPIVNRGAYIGKEPEAIPGVWGALLDLFEQKKVRGVAFEKIFE